MAAGLTPPKKKIKCPVCGKYKTAEHGEDENNGSCYKCDSVWGTTFSYKPIKRN